MGTVGRRTICAALAVVATFAISAPLKLQAAVQDTEGESVQVGDSPSLERSMLELRDAVRSLAAEIQELNRRISSQQPSDRSSGPATVRIDPAHSRGDKNAPLTIIEYADFECPYCAEFTRTVLPSLEREYIDTGRVRLAFWNMPLVEIHPLSLRAASVAECSGRQGKFWEAHDAMFNRTGVLTSESIDNATRVAGIDLEQLNKCLAGPVSAQVQRQAAEAAALLTRAATPTFLIGSTGPDNTVTIRVRIDGLRTVDSFRSALTPLLNQLEKAGAIH
jgi:protein-disulfide isomerase